MPVRAGRHIALCHCTLRSLSRSFLYSYCGSSSAWTSHNRVQELRQFESERKPLMYAHRYIGAILWRLLDRERERERERDAHLKPLDCSAGPVYMPAWKTLPGRIPRRYRRRYKLELRSRRSVFDGFESKPRLEDSNTLFWPNSVCVPIAVLAMCFQTNSQTSFQVYR